MIEHYVYGGLDSHGYVGYLVAFNAPKLLFLLMLEKKSTEEIFFIYLLLVPSFALVLTCGALLWGHSTVGDARSRGFVAGVVFGSLLLLLAMLIFLRRLLTDDDDDDDCVKQMARVCFTVGLAIVVPCGVLLSKLGTVHDSRGAGLLAGVVIGGLIGLGFVLFMLIGHFKDDCFVRQHPGWAPVLVVMPLVPCVLAIEAGFKGGGGRIRIGKAVAGKASSSSGSSGRRDAAKWNAHLLLIYMLTAYGSMGLMLRGGGAGLWTRCSLGACYALFALIAAMWLGFPQKTTALTAEGSSVLDKLDSGGGGRGWAVRLQQAAEGAAELDLSGCGYEQMNEAARVALHGALMERLGECQQLSTLNLEGCIGLTSLPERLGECQQLQKLNLEWCSSLTSLPERLGECQQLQELNLLGCSGLASLPERLGECQQLQELDLSYCSGLTSLPERLGECQQLKWLNLYGCGKLMVLPDLSSRPEPKVEGLPKHLSEWEKGGRKRYDFMRDGFPSDPTELDFRGCYYLTALPERAG
jgi:MFS family permease